MSDATLHPAAIPVERLLADCNVQRQRRSGPGGQHRNKVETAIRLTHRPSGVTAMAAERRSQAANHAQAVQRLRINLALAVRTDGAEPPSALWESRCTAGRIRISPEHADYPALLAEALDALHADHWDISTTAIRLGCTRSQLAKLLRSEPRALAEVNRQRAARCLKPLQ